jgi:hypothetical protein
MLNYSYHLLVLTILQAFAITPRISIARLGFLDNVHPRQALDKMEKLEKWDKATIRRLRRMQATHENCLESLGAVCAAVVSLPFVTPVIRTERIRDREEERESEGKREVVGRHRADTVIGSWQYSWVVSWVYDLCYGYVFLAQMCFQ